MPSSVVPACAPVSSPIATSSSGVAQRLATGWPSPSLCEDDCVNEKPERAGLERAAELGAHLGDLLGRRLAADRVRAHHVAADRAVADEEARVHRDAALEAVEELGEGLPLPVGAVLERGEGHALDLRHHPAEVVGVAVAERREGEAAVAADDGGDAVHARRARGGVPHELGVVVGVRVDEAGGDDVAGGVDLVRRCLVDRADRDDPSVADPDVGDAPGRTGAVDDGAALMTSSSMVFTRSGATQD